MELWSKTVVVTVMPWLSLSCHVDSVPSIVKDISPAITGDEFAHVIGEGCASAANSLRP